MKVGLVSDIHGNINALNKAFELLSDAELFICLGDAINQYRFSNEVAERLQQQCHYVIQGNHEEIFFSPLGERAQNANWIDADLMHWLSNKPSKQELMLSEQNILLVHSTPWSPTGEYVYPHSKDFSRLGDYSADILIYGHTHHAVAVEINNTLIINPGSTGQGQFIDKQLTFSCAMLEINENSRKKNCQLIQFTL